MANVTLKATSIMPSITVSDIEVSRRFYVDGLGFTLKDEWKDDSGKVNGLMLSAGSEAHGIGVAQDDFKKGRDRVKGIGTRVWIETNDVAAVAASIKAAGFPLESEAAPLPWGPIGFMVSDPDGYKFTVLEPSP
ncbi:MAG: VOC family protein [Gemmatimonadota bacterium]|nr:VOC family protein [Gemmatimonadota bacterium]